MNTQKISRGDRLTALILILFIAFLTFLTLNRTPSHWGDDSAAYMSDGIAIAQGRLKEQAKINYFYHPSPLDASVTEEGLVYPRGYPVILSLIARITGFDRTEYSDVIYYSVPTAAAFSLTAGILYLFFRRRMSRNASLLAVLFFCVSCDFFTMLNMLYSDIVFLFFAVLSMYTGEIYPEISAKKPVAKSLYALLFTFSVFAAYEVRLNGIAIAAIIAFYQIVLLIRQKKYKSAREIFFLLLPYALVILFELIGNRLLLPVTRKVSDTSSVTLLSILENFGYYFYKALAFYATLLGGVHWLFGIVLLPFILIGIYVKLRDKDNFHITLLTFGTYAVLLYLPFNQGYRYLYHVFPLLIYYIYCGGKTAYAYIRPKLDGRKDVSLRRAFALLIAVCLLVSYGGVLADGVRNIRNRRAADAETPYSEASIDMYAFIRENTPEDSVICFFKPRQLYLATERLSFRHGVNGHVYTDADYYLEADYPLEVGFFEYSIITDENAHHFRLIYENDELRFYEIVKES